MSIVPATRPNMPDEWVRLLGQALAKVDAPVHLVGRRGFYLDMGKPDANDRALYDDAIWLITPERVTPFNANCDPSHFRKDIANLVPGVWSYRVGKHKVNSPSGYTALVQAGAVTVARDQGKTESGWFGINIHRGGNSVTGSLGCQTIPPTQWDAFIAAVQRELLNHRQQTIPYILTAHS